MKSNSTLIRFTATLLFSIAVFHVTPASAQYCSPTFANGCSSWGSQSITLGSLNWSLGSFPCTDFDYTSMTVNLTTGVPHLLTVSNGSWCGCAVWIDLNQDFNFDVSENMFFSYQANASNTYSIYLTIPNGTPVASYRMRIISPWGSDGFSSANINGYGPCGAFQYGGFQDFTIVVTGPQGIEDPSGNNSPFMSASINPETNRLTVNIHDAKSKDITLQLVDVSGRMIESRKVTGETETMDVSSLSSGVYFLNYFDGVHKQNLKLHKY